MAEIRGIIIKKRGERAEVKVNKAESELKSLPKYLDCWNPVGAKAGDVVGAEYRDNNFLRYSFFELHAKRSLNRLL